MTVIVFESPAARLPSVHEIDWLGAPQVRPPPSIAVTCSRGSTVSVTETFSALESPVLLDFDREVCSDEPPAVTVVLENVFVT